MDSPFKSADEDVEEVGRQTSKWDSNKKGENAEINFNEPPAHKYFMPSFHFCSSVFGDVTFSAHWYIYSRPETFPLCCVPCGDFNWHLNCCARNAIAGDFLKAKQILHINPRINELWFALKNPLREKVANKFLVLMNFWRSSNIYRLLCDTFFRSLTRLFRFGALFLHLAGNSFAK